MSHFTTIPAKVNTKTPSFNHHHLSFHHLFSLYTSLINTLCNLPTSFFALLLILLLTYNALSIFSLHVTLSLEPSAVEKPPGHINIKISKLSPSSPPSSSTSSSASNVLYAVKEESFPRISKTQLRNLREEGKSIMPIKSFPDSRRKSVKKSKILKKVLRFRSLVEVGSKGFAKKVNDFFTNGSRRSCEVKFFMTWMASLDGFGDREKIGIQSLFHSHPKACLVIVSSTMESNKGDEILRPFWDKGYRVMSISPNYGFLFRNTPAEPWFEKLRKGKLNPGDVSLGQNLSNLLRLVLLYKFGGVYLDTDVMVLKNMSRLRNVIGAQTVDETGNWTRLNNAVLVFDKKHPLLFKFIQEFALTFDGSKWGHNGPYLVSRVVSRVTGRTGYDFTVLGPDAFYPVDWNRVRSLFRGPRSQLHSKWMSNKMNYIRRQSFVVHLWNRHSRNMEIESGSIVDRIISDCCTFCNSTLSDLSIRNKVKGLPLV